MGLSPIGKKIALPQTATGLLSTPNKTANSTPQALPPSKLSGIGQKLWQGNIGGVFGNENLNSTNAGIGINAILNIPRNTVKVGKKKIALPQTTTGASSSLDKYFPATNMVRNASVKPILPPPVKLSPIGKAIADKTKGVTISQGSPDPSALQNSSLAKIPILGKFLTGTGSNNRGLYAPNTFAGSLERQGALGFLMQGFKDYTNPDRKVVGEKFSADYDRMARAGSTPEQAQTGALQNLYNTKTPNMTGVTRSVDDIQNPGVELTDSQKKAVQLSNAGRKVMAIIDTPVFGGTTKAVKPVINTVADLNKLNKKQIIDFAKSTEGKNTTTSKELADGYAQNSSNEGVTIEFKPGAKAKMRFSHKFEASDLQADEYLGDGLTLDDVARVTDKNGKVIYQAAENKTGIKVCQNCLDESTKQAGVNKNLKVERGIYVPEASNADEAVKIAQDFYKNNPMTTQRLGKNTHAWNVDGKGDVYDFHQQGGKVTDSYKYVPESKLSVSSKSITPIDRLIAEGKVRVRMIKGKDTYEIKKGDTWRTVRDEDSAIKQLTPILPKPKAELPEKIQEKQYMLEVAKDALADDPAAQLVKYVPTKGEFKGTLREVTGKNGTFGNKGDDIATELGYKSSDEAREALDAYKVRQAEIKQTEAVLKAEIKAAKKAEKTVVKPTRVAKEQAASLEELANQRLESLPLPPRERPLSLDKIVAQTPVGKKVGFQDFLRTPDRVLRKIGFGKEADLIRDQYEKYVIELPKNIDKITAWQKRLPRGAGNKLFRYLDGEEVILTKEEQKVADEMKEYLSVWADRLKLPADKRVTNYITHLFEDQLIRKEFDEDLAKLIADKIPGQVYDPFLEKRLGAKGYRQDVWAALDAYTKRATRKVHMDPALDRIREKAGSSLEFTELEESQFKFIQKYIDSVNMRPTDRDKSIDIMIKQTFIGYRLGQRPLTRLLKILRQRTYVGMLGGNFATAMQNLSQGVNVYAVLGEKYTAIGYAKLFSAEARKELMDQGVFASNFIEDRSINVTMKMLQKIDNTLFIFFNTAEKINRGGAYLGAKSKYINQNMRVRDGVEVWKEGTSMETAIKYAKSIVRKTQFAYDPIDQPQLLAGDLAKTFGQFMSYPIKQTEFLAELAKDKNFPGLIRYGIGGMAFVYTIGQAFGMELEDLIPSFRFGLPPSVKFPAEVIKAAVDAPDKYGNDRDLKRKMKDIGNSTVGLFPGGNQIKKSIEGYQAAGEKGVYDAAGRQQFPIGGSPAEQAQAMLFGKYSGKYAKDYFNKVKTPEQQLKADKADVNKEAKDKMQPVYDQVQALKAEGKLDEAQAIVEGMTEEDYKVYVRIRTAERGDNTEAVRLKLELNPADAVQYLRSLPADEQERIINLLTDEEYARYETGKTN